MPTNITGQPDGLRPEQDTLSRDRLHPGMPGEDAIPGRQDTQRQQGDRDTRTVEGFGNEIPLALALRQIVPDRYSYSFDDGINHKTPISWDSGGSWRTTLRRALRAKGLEMQIDNRVVRIKQADRSMARQRQSGPQRGWQRGQLTQPRTRSASSQQRHTSQDRPKSSRVGMQYQSNNDGARSRMPTRSMAPVSMPAGQPGARASLSQRQARPDGDDRQGPSRDSGASHKPESRPEALSRTHSFEAGHGDSLRATLQDWSQKAGVELRWEPAYDFTLREDVEMEGDFAKAVSQLLAQYKKDAPKPHGRLHTTSDSGSPVLVIE